MSRKASVQDLDISVGFDLDVKIGRADREDHVLELTTPDGILCEKADVKVDLEENEHPTMISIELHSAHGIGNITLIMPLNHWSILGSAILRKYDEAQKEAE